MVAVSLKKKKKKNKKTKKKKKKIEKESEKKSVKGMREKWDCRVETSALGGY